MNADFCWKLRYSGRVAGVEIKLRRRGALLGAETDVAQAMSAKYSCFLERHLTVESGLNSRLLG